MTIASVKIKRIIIKRMQNIQSVNQDIGKRKFSIHESFALYLHFQNCCIVILYNSMKSVKPKRKSHCPAHFNAKNSQK